ncbi:MAG: hypothetical protein NVSMB57_08580 [Actinomycetota bacterium]
MMNSRRGKGVALFGAVLLSMGWGGAAAIPTRGADATMAWSPAYPEYGKDVTFSVDASSSGGSIETVSLDYGDGQAETHEPPRTLFSDAKACVIGGRYTFTTTHKFRHEGNYPLQLVVQSGACPPGALKQPATTVRYTIHVYDAATRARLEAATPPAGTG